MSNRIGPSNKNTESRPMLTPADKERDQVLFCVNIAIRYYKQKGRPVPKWMVILGQRLDLLDALISEMSVHGHQSDSGSAELDLKDVIDVKEAARILGLSERQVRRIKTDLDHLEICGTTVFRRSVVLEYHQVRRAHR